jgi:hypothetical protein
MRVLAVICILSSITSGQRLPETMTKLTVRLQSPDVPEDSFVAKPSGDWLLPH